MALSTPFTLTEIRAIARRELLDPTGKWWSNDEIDEYINDWNHLLQSQFEFVWGTATLTFTNTTTQYTFTVITTQGTTTYPDFMRVDAIYYRNSTNTSTGRLSPRSMSDLDTFQRNWRHDTAQVGIDPIIVYQQDAQSVSFWPPPAGTGTAYFEYPVLSTMTVATDPMAAPAWLRYSATPYVLYRAYARFAATQDLGKATRYRKVWDNQLQLAQRFYDGYFPDRAEMLRPGRKWAGNILRTKPAWPIWR